LADTCLLLVRRALSAQEEKETHLNSAPLITAPHCYLQMFFLMGHLALTLALQVPEKKLL
jgi:hypothetical protein